MNPYEEPQANLEAPIVQIAPRQMDWMSLFAAGLICFIVMSVGLTIVVNFFSSNNRPAQWMVVILCFVIPCGFGAAYLGWKVSTYWFAHAAIYSFIPPLITLAWVSNQFRSTKQFIAIALIVQLASIFVTMLTMSATRAIVKTVDSQAL